MKKIKPVKKRTAFTNSAAHPQKKRQLEKQRENKQIFMESAVFLSSLLGVPERHPGFTFPPIQDIQYLCALVKFNERRASPDKRRLIYAEEKARGLTSIINN